MKKNKATCSFIYFLKSTISNPILGLRKIGNFSADGHFPPGSKKGLPVHSNELACESKGDANTFSLTLGLEINNTQVFMT